MKIGLIAFTLYFMMGCGTQTLPKESFENEFISSVWMSPLSLDTDENLITKRQKMLGDLVSRHLENKTRSEVILILGNSSKKMDPDGIKSGLSYPTGPQRGSYFQIDHEWLIIEFNDTGIYKAYSIQSD